MPGDIVGVSMKSSRRGNVFDKHGGILLMMLVILGVLVVVIGSTVSFVNRQFHEITRQKQEEQVFHVAEAGVNHVSYLLNDRVYNTVQLLNLISPIQQDVMDPSTNTRNGFFSLTFSGVDGSQPGQAVRVTSVAKADDSERCQTIIATFHRLSSGDDRFVITKWDHVPQCVGNYVAPQSPPTLESVTPPDNAPPPDVPIDTNLSMTFSKAVDIASGYVHIKNTDGSIAQSINVTDTTPGVVSGSGTNTIVINPPQDLVEGTQYYINIDAGAFEDSNNLPFAGIPDTDITRWNFQTISVPPTLVIKDPPDGADNVQLDKRIAMTFSEPVWAGPGTITINGGPTPITVNATSAEGLSTNIITLLPQALNYSTDYYITITNNAFKDAEPTWYDGITNPNDWNFTTVACTPSVETKSSILTFSGNWPAIWNTSSHKALIFRLTNQLNEYDPVTNTVTSKQPGANDPNYATVAAVWDSTGQRAYLLRFSQTAGDGALAKIFEYNPQTNFTTTKLPLPNKPMTYAAVVWNTSQRKALLFYNDRSIYEYDPVQNTITQKSGLLPSVRYQQSAVWNSNNNKAYIIGGVYSSTLFDDILVYDPVSDANAVEVAQLPEGLDGTVSVFNAAENKIYVLGGRGVGGYKNRIYVFNPAINIVALSSSTLPRNQYNGDSNNNAVWNPDNQHSYLFGGQNGVSDLNDIIDIINVCG